MSNKKIYLSAYWVGGKRKDLTAYNMSTALKFASTALNYPYLKRILVSRMDTNSLRGGGANVLSLVGYRNRDIQKLGYGEGKHLRSTYSRNYIVLTAMNQYFKYFNISGREYSDLVGVTRTTVVIDYQLAAESA